MQCCVVWSVLAAGSNFGGGSSSGVDVGVLEEHGYGWTSHQLTGGVMCCYRNYCARRLSEGRSG
jgi:hypothetical protein